VQVQHRAALRRACRAQRTILIPKDRAPGSSFCCNRTLGEARLHARGSVCLDDASLYCFIDRLVKRRDIWGAFCCNRFLKINHRILHGTRTACVEHALPQRLTVRFLGRFNDRHISSSSTLHNIPRSCNYMLCDMLCDMLDIRRPTLDIGCPTL